MTIEQIMREERERTLAALAALPLPSGTRDDVLLLCAGMMRAVNETIAALDRVIDQRSGPAAMRLMADEIERINRRLVDAGLSEPLQ